MAVSIRPVRRDVPVQVVHQRRVERLLAIEDRARPASRSPAPARRRHPVEPRRRIGGDEAPAFVEAGQLAFVVGHRREREFRQPREAPGPAPSGPRCRRGPPLRVPPAALDVVLGKHRSGPLGQASPANDGVRRRDPPGFVPATAAIPAARAGRHAHLTEQPARGRRAVGASGALASRPAGPGRGPPAPPPAHVSYSRAIRSMVPWRFPVPARRPPEALARSSASSVSRRSASLSMCDAVDQFDVDAHRLRVGSASCTPPSSTAGRGSARRSVCTRSVMTVGLPAARQRTHAAEVSRPVGHRRFRQTSTAARYSGRASSST